MKWVSIIPKQHESHVFHGWAAGIGCN
jgi:hypothetical protein